MTATVRDLLDLAEEHGQPVPPLLASTILVQILAEITSKRQPRRSPPTPENTFIEADSLTALLADPSRDPKIRLSAGTQATSRSSEMGAQAAAELAAMLFASHGGEPPPGIAVLLGRMLDERPEARPSTAAAYEEARSAALELFAAEEQIRRAGRLEERLRLALDSRQEAAVTEMSAELESLAPESLMLAVARSWLDQRASERAEVETTRKRLLTALYGRDGSTAEAQFRCLTELLGEDAGTDGDLDLARGWLAERRRTEERRLEKRRKDTVKLVVTGAPLVLATILSGLLFVVMAASGH